MLLTTTAFVSETKLQCPICDKQFKRKDNLQRHSKIHSATPQYHCRHCNQYFSSSESLAKHNAEKHDSPLLCSTCGKTFQSKSAAKRHAALQHQILPDMPSKLTIHECPYQDCSKRFNQKTKYIDHLNIHTGDKPYYCAHCEKRFASRYLKNQHAEICGGKVSLVCPHCGLAYSSKTMLERHIDAKHLLKPYPCQCGKVFAYQSTLCRHRKDKNH